MLLTQRLPIIIMIVCGLPPTGSGPTHRGEREIDMNKVGDYFASLWGLLTLIIIGLVVFPFIIIGAVCWWSFVFERFGHWAA
jgi:hypothetical protein